MNKTISTLLHWKYLYLTSMYLDTALYLFAIIMYVLRSQWNKYNET